MHLVVCVDGSQGSDRALSHAVELATATDGELTVVHAVDPQVYEERGSGPVAGAQEADRQYVLEAVEDAEARGEEILDEAADLVTDVPVDSELLYGAPVDAISEYVGAHDDVDGIVVGHREITDRYERVLGSVAKGLVERAPVPVTVVRDGS